MADDPSTPGADVATEKKPFVIQRSPTQWLLALVTAAGLAVDAAVHWHLAPNFDTLIGAASPHISQGQLFRIEAAVAIVAVVLVLATPRRLAAAFAFLVAAGGLFAVLLYRFVDVGGFGPMPDMYDPTWYTEKSLSALAQVVAAVAALGLFLLPHPDELSNTDT